MHKLFKYKKPVLLAFACACAGGILSTVSALSLLKFYRHYKLYDFGLLNDNIMMIDTDVYAAAIQYPKSENIPNDFVNILINDNYDELVREIEYEVKYEQGVTLYDEELLKVLND